MPQFDLSSFCLQNTMIIFSFYYLYNICLTLFIPFTGFLLKTRNRLSKFKKIGKAFSSSIVKWNTFLKSNIRLVFFLTKVQTEDRSFGKLFISYVLVIANKYKSFFFDTKFLLLKHTKIYDLKTGQKAYYPNYKGTLLLGRCLLLKFLCSAFIRELLISNFIEKVSRPTLLDKKAVNKKKDKNLKPSDSETRSPKTPNSNKNRGAKNRKPSDSKPQSPEDQNTIKMKDKRTHKKK